MKVDLVKAVQSNEFDSVKESLNKGANVNQKDSSGNSLLIISAANGYAEMVQLLLSFGADLSAVDANMKATALHAAASLGHPEVMKILVEYGIKIDYKGPYNGYTALHDAVLQNNIEGVKILIKSGADINIKGKDGNTPLMLAKNQENLEIAEILKHNYQNSQTKVVENVAKR